jgi:RHH-type proline utilization regulon transcriptional repressor/proline dehydrogenase/delta 1-pyrroline-5-carboxylate dehydrogenase
VLDGVYDAFVSRLAEALPSWTVGPADDPDSAVPPVISQEARDRIEQAQQVARSEGRVVADVDVGALRDRGHYVGPLIVADVDPQAQVAQEEIFGPVLAVIRARDLDEALRVANGVQYALTGGLYSRSPAHIEQVKRSFRVGNLYINRPCTGALVDRQPFGGFKMSGIGTKAGGPDYLLEFLLARSVTENTMRRGFAPEIDELGEVEVQARAGI